MCVEPDYSGSTSRKEHFQKQNANCTGDILTRYKGTFFHCEGCQSLSLLQEAVDPPSLRIFDSKIVYSPEQHHPVWASSEQGTGSDDLQGLSQFLTFYGSKPNSSVAMCSPQPAARQPQNYL